MVGRESEQRVKPDSVGVKLGAYCGESRTMGSEGEVSWSNLGIDSNQR